ncbi:MAG: very short patch repair endonuclease [Nanoarchaeota archaeon]|nr:very short patch repair endonuclease [Nanoarchaeota archaeon]
MSKIKSKWTAQEKKLHNHLKGNKVKHKMHPNISGSPDILLTDSNTAIFINGCFWHKCPKCYKKPKSNKSYWMPKIEKNIRRDKKNYRSLKKLGYLIIKIWEHDVKKDLSKVISKLIKKPFKKLNR